MTPKDSPYIDHIGTMIVPFSADQKYHFWNGGQPLLKTLLELNVAKDIWAKHTEDPYPENADQAEDVASGKKIKYSTTRVTDAKGWIS